MDEATYNRLLNLRATAHDEMVKWAEWAAQALLMSERCNNQVDQIDAMLAKFPQPNA